jgi:hypothetical protein
VNEAIALVTTRGTFHYYWTPGVSPIRGAGAGQLARALRVAR